MIVGHARLLKISVSIALKQTSRDPQFCPDFTSIIRRWALAERMTGFVKQSFAVPTKQHVLEPMRSNAYKRQSNATTTPVLVAQNAAPGSIHQIMNVFLAQTRISCLFIWALLLWPSSFLHLHLR
jgi:hypothetical protein